MPEVEESLKTLSSEDLAYIAGFTDGEGYIGIVRNQGLRLFIQITNTKPEVLYWMKELFGGSIHKGQYKSESDPRFFNAKPTYKWTIVSRQAETFLEAIQPYLRIKSELCQFALDFQVTKLWGEYNSKNPPPEDIVDYREWIREQVRELNHKGRN